MTRRAPGIGWLVAGLCLAGAAPAQTPDAPGAGADATGRTGEATELSLEFLEFLGTWESSDGEWIDPTSVPAADWPVQRDQTSSPETGDAN